MIFDSKKHAGECTCGKSHKIDTLFCIVESGCLKNIDKYMKEYNLKGYCVAVYDQNTYKATADRHPQVDCEVVLPANNLHANEHGVDLLLEKLPKETELLIAIGAGTIHDITRYCAYERKIDFISCPTAASVDGFCSSVAAMTWGGCKKTLAAVAPKIVLADLDIIKNAPLRLAKSGFGDMIGKYVSLTDWKIGNILIDEHYCEKIANMTFNATKEVMLSAENIINEDESAYEKLMYGLLLSGIAMQMLGNSRPASAAEHHISHLIEMEPEALNVHSTALHGEKVGVGTLMAIDEYKKLAKKVIAFRDYECYPNELIYKVFGKASSTGIINENENDVAKGITGKKIASEWPKIYKEIEKIPETEDLLKLYNKLEICKDLSDIEVENDLKEKLLDFSPMVRNRLTLMRIRKCLIED